MSSDERLHIDGLAGPIEAVLHSTGGGRAAVLCHPHPLFGGSMEDAVVAAIGAACAAAGISALRFNFRGVGTSAGEHDRGVGEAADVVHLVRWLRNERGYEEVLLAGYSFGGSVALRAAIDQGVSVQRLVLVAPALGRQPGTGVDRLPCPLVLVQGGRDSMVNGASSIRWARALRSPVEVVEVPDADHFFGGALADIISALDGRLA